MFQNPYLPGYQLPQYQQAQYQPPTQVTRVNGENGAKAYQLPPNSSILLLDESAPVVWLKTTDGAGYPTITPYDIKPVEQKKETDVYSALEERITRLEAKLNESNIANVERVKNAGGQYGTDQKRFEHGAERK